jgi:hypothetical protein
MVVPKLSERFLLVRGGTLPEQLPLSLELFGFFPDVVERLISTARSIRFVLNPSISIDDVGLLQTGHFIKLTALAFKKGPSENEGVAGRAKNDKLMHLWNVVEI